MVWMAVGYSQKWIQCNKKGKREIMVMWLVAAVQQFFATIQTYHGALGKGQW